MSQLLEMLDKLGYDEDADGWVYSFFLRRAQGPDDNKRFIYVGQTKNIRNRLSDHGDAGYGPSMPEKDKEQISSDIPYYVESLEAVKGYNLSEENADDIGKLLRKKERDLYDSYSDDFDTLGGK